MRNGPPACSPDENPAEDDEVLSDTEFELV